MTPIHLRVGNKLIGKSLIAALASLSRVLGHYREARKSLRGSTSRQSRQGLDWMNFFLADVQTAFGAFVAFYLADLGWPKDHVGLALTVGTLAGVISQIPGGAGQRRRDLSPSFKGVALWPAGAPPPSDCF
jgi:hypothetical protein